MNSSTTPVPEHAFVRPGQVAPGRPAPDKCMTCGQPAAAHGPLRYGPPHRLELAGGSVDTGGEDWQDGRHVRLAVDNGSDAADVLLTAAEAERLAALLSESAAG
jgi:hypothetical protein